MIDRLTVTGSPIQPRINVSEVERTNPIKIDKNTASTNQSGEKPSQYNNPKKEKVEAVVNGLNHFLDPSHTSIRFKLHDKLNEYYVTIVDDNTNEVLKEIPAKKLLDIYADMEQRLGLLVDKKI
jgi:flagellar protein FlaG